MDGNRTDIMTLGEVAAYLKLAEKTVLRLVHRRELPCFKVASQWRFRRSDIDEWIMTRIQSIHSSDLAQMIHSYRDSVPLSRILDRELILPDVAPGDKPAVLHQLMLPLVRRGVLLDSETFLERLMVREKIASTAIGHGIAFPHVRRARENPTGGPYLVIGICPEGTDFDALDGGPTHLFMLICAESEILHLRLMAKLTLLMRGGDLVGRLASASSTDAVTSGLLEAEWEKLVSGDPG